MENDAETAIWNMEKRQNRNCNMEYGK